MKDLTVVETTYFTSVSSVASGHSDVTITQTPTGNTINRQPNLSGIQIAGLAAGVTILLLILAITTAISLLVVLRKGRRSHNRKIKTDDNHLGTCHSTDEKEYINETDWSTNQKSIVTMPNCAYQSETVGCTPTVPMGLSPNPGDSSSSGLRVYNSNNSDTGLSSPNSIEHDTNSMIYCAAYNDFSPTTRVEYDYPTHAHEADLTQKPALDDTPRQLENDNSYEYITLHTQEGD